MFDDIKTDKDFVERLAKAITHIVYRNGIIENIHSNPDKNLYDSDMKLINKEVHNRIYTLLLTLFSDDRMANRIKRDCIFEPWPICAWNFGTNWDKAEIDYSIISPKYYKDIKRIESKLSKTRKGKSINE